MSCGVARLCRGLGVVVAALLLPACASGPPLAERAEPPGDFALAVTVVAPPALARQPDAPPGLRPARYVVQPDWVLRAGLSPADATPDAYPGRVRQLSREQVVALWVGLRDAGLLDPAHPARAATLEEPLPAVDRRSRFGYAVYWSAGGSRSRLLFEGEAAEGSPAALLAADLSRLARFAE